MYTRDKATTDGASISVLGVHSTIKLSVSANSVTKTPKWDSIGRKFIATMTL